MKRKATGANIASAILYDPNSQGPAAAFCVRSSCQMVLMRAISAELEADIARIKTIWHELRTQNAAAGPWLFGPYSIADAMFAPVAFRFITYGVSEPGAVDDYTQTAVRDPLVQEWMRDSKLEQERVASFEVGV